MHALAFEQFGGPDVLEYLELPTPAVAAGAVQVRMGAAGLNFAVIHSNLLFMCRRHHSVNLHTPCNQHASQDLPNTASRCMHQCTIARFYLHAVINQILCRQPLQQNRRGFYVS